MGKVSVKVAIEAAHYEETRQRLLGDAVVVRMAAEIRSMDRTMVVHDDGSPRWDFMRAANQTYRERGGDQTQPLHIGAVAEAIVILLEWDKDVTA